MLWADFSALRIDRRSTSGIERVISSTTGRLRRVLKGLQRSAASARRVQCKGVHELHAGCETKRQDKAIFRAPCLVLADNSAVRLI